MALVVDGQTLQYIVRRWALFGISMPLFLGPRSKAAESAKDGKFCFDVTISHPLTGLIVRYRGLLRLLGEAWREPRKVVTGEIVAGSRIE
jgi:hypothetical protein